MKNINSLLAFKLTLLFVLISIVGCGKGTKTLDAQYNAYVCGKCQVKFYTDGNVYANVCPQCKDGSQLQEQIAYVCPSDKTVTISARSVAEATCKQCGNLVTATTYPSEAALKAWGASHKSASDVGVK